MFRRLLRGAAALALGLVLCEILLQAAGSVVLATQGRGGVGGPGEDPGDVPGLRVLCVGDSNTFGWKEAAQDSYPARLEALLDARASGGPHRVYNLGMPGMNSGQVARRMSEELERYRPDVVLAMVGFNNRWSWSPASKWEDDEPPWYEHLRLVKLGRIVLRRVVSGAEAGQAGIPFDGRKLPGDLALTPLAGGGATVRDLDREGRPVSYDAGSRVEALADDQIAGSVLDDLAHMQAQARAAGAEFVLLTYCSDERDYAFANQSLRAAAAELEAPLVECAAACGQLLPELGFDALFHPDHHPRPRGYEVVARLALASLVELGVVDAQPLRRPLEDLPAAPDRPARIRLAGHLGARGSDGPRIEIWDELPDGEFLLVLAGRRADDPAERVDFHGHLLPVPEDEVFAQMYGREGTFGRFDESGRAVVSLAPLLGEGDSLRHVGKRLVALYLTFWGPQASQVREVSAPVDLVLQ